MKNFKLKYGDIIQFEPISLGGRLIKLIDGGKYSHSAMFWKYEKGIPLFIESHESKGGIVISVLQEWRDNYDVYRPEVEMRPVQEVLTLAQLDGTYDYHRLWNIFKHKVFGTPLFGDSPTKPICSELVNYASRYKICKAGTATPRAIEESKKVKKVYGSEFIN